MKLCVPLSTGSSMNSETASLFKEKCYLCKKRKNALESNERFPVTIGIDKAVETLGMKKM